MAELTAVRDPGLRWAFDSVPATVHVARGTLSSARLRAAAERMAEHDRRRSARKWPGRATAPTCPIPTSSPAGSGRWPDPVVSLRRRTPRTAFVLSGGGNLGALQVGMLKALAEHEIVPDLVLGCSVGALNGAAYAARSHSGRGETHGATLD